MPIACLQAEQQPYDVVLMDVQMPVMDGITATQKIYQQQHDVGRERPYIIAMTANALKGDRKKLLDAGMDDYISKPIRIESLATALQKVPQKKPVAKSLKTPPILALQRQVVVLKTG